MWYNKPPIEYDNKRIEFVFFQFIKNRPLQLNKIKKMLRFTILLLVSFFINQALLTAQSNNAMQQLKTDVVYLASDYLEGRESGLKGEQLAGEYIAWRFEQLGLEPKGDQRGWFHAFDFTYKSHPHDENGEEREGRNVVGFLNNDAPNTIIIGAHYDHLGHGIAGSRHTDNPAIHNGADDNASGVAALLYMADQLRDMSNAKANNYLFIAFSAEELGLIGSKRYVENPTIDLGTVNYMLNMDMVGRLNEEKTIAIAGVGTSPIWSETIERIKVGGIKAETTASGIGPSDHTSFYLEEIPVLHFFTGQHSDYHKPEDDAEFINFEGLMSVSDYLLALVKKVNGEGKLEFTTTKDERQQEGKSSRSSYKVSLGVMPDYVFGGKGMRIDSVIEDRPGQKAGMKAKDVIIKMGDLSVGDIYDYMEGLSKYNTGDTTNITIKRGGEEIVLSVTF